MSPAICFNLDKSDNLSSGNGLKAKFNVSRLHTACGIRTY